MSELSEADYRNKTREIIDNRVYEPDLIFQALVNYYLESDPEDDLLWDAQDDMEELFDGMADILAENFRNQPHGSTSESEDAKRFRKVRNWVENTIYNDEGHLVTNQENPTNPGGKFSYQMDKLMHLLAGSAIAANFGETPSDVASFITEVGDEAKYHIRKHRQNGLGGGFDLEDLKWGMRGSELQNKFDVSDRDARTLAKKFASGDHTLSRWQEWYGDD